MEDFQKLFELRGKIENKEDKNMVHIWDMNIKFLTQLKSSWPDMSKAPVRGRRTARVESIKKERIDALRQEARELIQRYRQM